VKTAQSYILNSIALGLHQKRGGRVILTPYSKAILCLRKPYSNSIRLSKSEKAILLSLHLKNDIEGFFPLLLCLNERNSITIKDIGSSIWTDIFQNVQMKRLKGTARMHRLIPRLEWCIDLDLVEKERHRYYITSLGKRFIKNIEKCILSPYEISLKLYFQGSAVKATERLYKKFLSCLSNAYLKLSILIPNAYHVEIIALKLLVLSMLASNGLLLSEKEFEDLLVLTWKRNIQRVRFSSSAKGNREGIAIRGRFYNYLTLSSQKLE